MNTDKITQKYSFAFSTLLLAICSFSCLIFMLIHPNAVFIGMFLGLTTIISGHFVLSRIKRKKLLGKKLALVGLIIGYIYIPVLCGAYIGSTLLFNNIINNYRAFDMSQIIILCERYIEDNNGKIPEDLEILVEKSGCSPDLLISTFSKVKDKPSYKIIIKGNIDDYSDKSNTVMITEVTPHKLGNKIVAYLDGRVEIIDDD